MAYPLISLELKEGVRVPLSGLAPASAFMNREPQASVPIPVPSHARLLVAAMALYLHKLIVADEV